MKYAIVCPNWHSFDFIYPESVEDAECPTCGLFGRRDYEHEFRSQVAVCDDHIRRSYLGAQIDHNLAAQGRPLDPLAPRDKFDLRRIEAATGRVYCGDNIGHLSAKAQKAILQGEKPKGASKPRL